MYRKRSATTKTVPCRTSIASIPIKRPNCKEALTQILSKHVSAMRFRVICSLLNESLIYVDSGWTRQPFLGNVCNRRNRYLLMFGERLVFEVRIVAVRIVRVIYVFVMLIKIREGTIFQNKTMDSTIFLEFSSFSLLFYFNDYSFFFVDLCGGNDPFFEVRIGWSLNISTWFLVFFFLSYETDLNY